MQRKSLVVFLILLGLPRSARGLGWRGSGDAGKAAPLFTAGLTLALVLATLGTAAAGVTEIVLPEGQQKPLAPAVDAEGLVWVTLDGSWAVARHDLSTGETERFDLAAGRVGAEDSLYSLVVDSDGFLWTASQTHLHRIAPNGSSEAYALPGRSALSGGVFPASDGTVWVAAVTVDRLVAFDIASGQMSTVATPPGFGPLEWAQGPGDQVFVTGTYGNTIGVLDLATKTFGTPPTPFVGAPTGIGYDGGLLWLGEHGGSSLVRYDVSSGKSERFPTAASPYYPISGPSGIVVAPDGAIWFAVHFADRVSRVDPATRTIVEYEVPSGPGANIQRVAMDSEGRVWFGEWSKDRIGYATYGGEMPDFELPAHVNVTRGSSVKIPFDSAGEFRFGTTNEKITLTKSGAQIILTAADDATLGQTNVVVSKLEGKTYVGRYVAVQVGEATAETPLPTVPLTLLALAVAGTVFAARWRRA